MMGSYQQAQMPVTQQQAMEIAQDFLDVAYSGLISRLAPLS